MSDIFLSKLATEQSSKSTNVQVAVRCRPVNSDERKSGQACVIACDPESKTVKVSYGPGGKKIVKPFTFDKVSLKSIVDASKAHNI
jgi:kinesin family protein 11